MQRLFHTSIFLTLPLVALLAVGFGGGEAAAPEDEHGHGGGTAVTRWTEDTELFFEYPPMIAGEPSEPWAIHLTRLLDFSSVTEGTLTLAFRGPDGTVYTTRSEAPARPGIYTPTPQLPQPGSYELVVDVSGPQLQDRIRVGEIEVYAGEDAVPHQEERSRAAASPS